MRALCRLDEIPDGGSRGFGAPPGGFTGLLAVRRGGTAHVYVNACPHLGVGPDWSPDRFLTEDGAFVVCSTHGALFRIEDGHCVSGPCVGDGLEAVPVMIKDGVLLVPDDAGL